MALNITLIWPTFPPGVPLTLAALRRAATVSLSGTVATGDINPGAITAPLVTPGPYWFAVDAGSTDAYAATYVPAVGSLVNGLEVAVQVATANTGPCTFNANGLGAIPIKKHGGSQDLDDNDLRAHRVAVLRYNDDVDNLTPAPFWELLSTLGNRPRELPMMGATPYSAGQSGSPAAPNAGDQNKYFRGDNTWQDLTSLITTTVAQNVTTNQLFSLLNFR